MFRTTAATLAFTLTLISLTACGATKKPAEVPDFTEKGWSGPSTEVAQAKADPPIQSAPKKDDAAKAAPPGKSATGSTSDADVASGAALPPSPKAAKPAKTKKPTRPTKKAS